MSEKTIKHRRRVVHKKTKQHIYDFFRNLLFNIDHHDVNLSTLEYMMMSNLYQMNANYVFQFLELALMHNTVSICIVYILLLSTLGIPFSMLLIFMSSYSRKSFLGFWQCVPLFEGIGYSAGIIRLSVEVFNVIQAGKALLFLVHIQNPNFSEHVRSCEFAVGTRYEPVCVSPQHNTSVTRNVFTSFQTYYRVEITSFVRFDDLNTAIPNINFTLFLAVTSLWILIFILASLGMKRIRRFFLYPEFFILFIIICLSVFVICCAKKGQIKDTRQIDNPLVKFDFWVTLILHASEINYLGNTIWIGTMMPNYLHPKFAALLNPPIKMVVFLSLLCMVTIVFQDNALHYQLDDINYVTVSADDVLFILIPDVLLRYKSWQFTLFLWYGGLCYFMILPPVYTIIGFLISIEDKFPKLINYRILSCAFTCTVGLICTFPLTTEIGTHLVMVWKYCGFTVLVSSLLLIVNLAIFFVYTTDQVINDYTFTYGNPPERYWTTLWKCCPLFSLFAFLLALTFQSSTDTSSNYASFVMTASYVHAALMLSPILVIAVIKFCTHVQNRKLGDLIQPSPEWGPRDEATNLARKNYYPRRNVRFRVNKLICQHKCTVVNQESYLKEKENQRMKLDMLFKSL